MADFMMIMKGPSSPNSEGDWESYINKLKDSGFFRGGSMLDNGECLNKLDIKPNCSVTGFMRFEADSIEQVKALVVGNPTYENGRDVEVLEVVFSGISA